MHTDTDELDPFDSVDAYYLIEERAENRRLISERDAAQAELARLRGELEAYIEELEDGQADPHNTPLLYSALVIPHLRAILDPEQETT